MLENFEAAFDAARMQLQPATPEPVVARAAPSIGKPMRVMRLAECAAEQPRPGLVKGLIRPGDVVLVIGPPGAGKSVFAPYLAHRIATGLPVFGRRVRAAPVVYVAAEDASGLILRGAALLRVMGDAPGFHLVPSGIDLMTTPAAGDPMPHDATELRRLAVRVGAGAIVIDTLAASFPGLQENEAAPMDHVVRVARYLAATGAAVILLHHVAKAGGTTPRGHGRLDGDADLTLLIETQEGSDVRTVRIGKNRSGSSLDRFTFRIRAEHLGYDEDGDAITAPIAEEEDEQAGAPSRKVAAERRLSDANTILIRELRLALVDGEMVVPMAGMPQLRAISRAALRCALIRAA